MALIVLQAVAAAVLALLEAMEAGGLLVMAALVCNTAFLVRHNSTQVVVAVADLVLASAAVEVVA
jgi:hypothetical protein